MATCKDCVHAEVCRFKDLPAPLSDSYIRESECIEKRCGDFKDRSRFVELPDVSNYDAVTTIDEAIDHCYQIATSTDETVCAECKAEHMRLCGWLGDLKRRIAAEQALKECEINGYL